MIVRMVYFFLNVISRVNFLTMLNNIYEFIISQIVIQYPYISMKDSNFKKIIFSQ